MLKLRIDTRQLEAKLRKVAQASGPARRESLSIMVARVMRTVDETAPRDTNAFADSWAAAANSAGIGPFAIRPLNRANRKGVARLGDWLRSAEAYWGKIVESNEARGRTGKWPTDAKQKLAQAKVKVAAFYSKNPNVQAAVVTPGGMTRGTTVLEFGGGHGEWQQAADRTYLRLSNERRGAKFIEQRFRTMSIARAPFKKIGLTSMGGKRFAEKIAIAAGLAVKLPGRR